MFSTIIDIVKGKLTKEFKLFKQKEETKSPKKVLANSKRQKKVIKNKQELEFTQNSPNIWLNELESNLAINSGGRVQFFQGREIDNDFEN